MKVTMVGGYHNIRNCITGFRKIGTHCSKGVLSHFPSALLPKLTLIQDPVSHGPENAETDRNSCILLPVKLQDSLHLTCHIF